jgi:hypothetical protein
MSKYVHVIGGDDDGRCLAIVINFIYRAPIKLFSVYFPCYSASIQYNVELGNCLGFKESLLQPTDGVIIVGDANFTCSIEHTGYAQCRSVLDRLSTAHCNEFCDELNPVTYVSSHLNCQSFIDHCFVSNTIRQCLQYSVIVDSGINLNDHRQFIANFTFNTQPVCTNKPIYSVKSTATKYVWRWDKTNLSL